MSLFDPLVDAYDAARPGYPADLYDALPALSGRRVVEVGAGTGIATRELLARGADLVALDIGPKMLGRNKLHTPELRAALADGRQLPLRDSSVDLVCYAQAWHWIHSVEAAAEQRRVLADGGALALWWNYVDADGERWHEDQQERLEAWSPGYTRTYRDHDYTGLLEPLFAEVTTTVVRWHRTIDLDTYVTWLLSKSYVAALGDRLEEFLEEERASMLEAFPDGQVREPFRVELVLARR